MATRSMPPHRDPRPRRRDSVFTVWATALSLVCVWVVLTQEMLVRTRDADFLNLYTGFSLARDGQLANLHDLTVQYARERLISPDVKEFSPFNRPHFYAALLSPVSWLAHKTVWPYWLAGHLALLLGCFWWGQRRFGHDAVLLGAVFYPPFTAIAHGQDAVFMTAIFIAAWALFEKKKGFLAGLVLAFALMKWHLIVLFPVAMLLRRQWKMLAGFVTAAAAAVAFMFVGGGLAGARNYYQLLSGKFEDGAMMAPQLMLNIAAIPANFNFNGLAPKLILGSLVLLSAMWIWLVGKQDWLCFSATAVASMLVVPHVYVYDASALLIVIWLVYRNAQTLVLRRYLLWIASPLPYLAVAFPPPYSAVAAISLTLFLGALWWEARKEGQTLPGCAPSPREAALAGSVVAPPDPGVTISEPS